MAVLRTHADMKRSVVGTTNVLMDNQQAKNMT
jgi:hypothetical protein